MHNTMPLPVEYHVKSAAAHPNHVLKTLQHPLQQSIDKYSLEQMVLLMHL